MYGKADKMLKYRIYTFVGVIVMMFSSLAIAMTMGIVTFQCQKPRCEVLFSYQDKWVAMGATMPYVITGH